MRRSSKQKQVTFDIDVVLLQKHYPDPKHWRKAYTDIKKEFESEGFIWREGSVYVSDKPVSQYGVLQAVIEIKAALPWLKKCMKDIRASDIGEFHDLTDFIKEGNLVSNKDKKLISSSEDLKGYRKQLVFDLLYAKMEKDHPGMSKWAYSELRIFLEKRGFRRIQQTGYESVRKISLADVAILCSELHNAFPWLKDYLRDCRIGNIYSSHNLTPEFTGKDKEKNKEENRDKEKKPEEKTARKEKAQSVSQPQRGKTSSRRIHRSHPESHSMER